MTTKVFIVDTSYLLELFKVPGFSEERAAEEIRKRHKLAIENSSRLYVPLPCICQLADHITDIADGNHRRKLGQKLLDTVKTSVEQSVPWTITPSIGIEFLPSMLKEFLKKYIAQGIDFTDASVIQEALRLKKKYGSFNFEVHIWTKDSALKAQEPDCEGAPFLG